MSFTGLHKRPTYDEIINYIGEHQEKIKYPNRDATLIRNSPYLSQFDGENNVLDFFFKVAIDIYINIREYKCMVYRF